MLAHHRAFAALDNIPFIGDKYPFTLSFKNNPEISGALEATIKNQRQQSAEFKAAGSAPNAARFDRDVIKRWLESEGYFAHRINTEFDENRIIYKINAGPIYKVASVRITFPSNAPPPKKSFIPLKKGKPLRAEDVLASQSVLKHYVQEHYCLFKIDLDYIAEVNHETQRAFVQFILKPSPNVTFGTAQIVGTQQVKNHYLQNFITFEPEQCFKRKDIELSRLGLLQSNLLSRVDIIVAEPENDRVIVTFEVTERSHRTIKAGVGYDSNTGERFTAGWQHRNLFHRGERFDVESHLSDIDSDVTGELLVPHFRRKNQSLTLTSKLSHQTPEGYTYTSGEVGASINRPLSQRWAGNVGVNLEFSHDKREEQREDYGLLSVPLSLDFNRSNQLVDPSNGWAVSIQTRPFIDIFNSGTQFTKTALSVSAYFGARNWIGSPILAFRTAAGSVSGAQLDEIPSVHRYYVGGGGSVRGYGYQMAGELEDQDNKKSVPVGGLSFGEASMELRLRFSQNWGGVLFVDGGYAYSGKRPNFGKDFLWGSGIGVRYFTSFAPIRFDIASPMEKRLDADGKNIDDGIQIYISIGQAF